MLRKLHIADDDHQVMHSGLHYRGIGTEGQSSMVSKGEATRESLPKQT